MSEEEATVDIQWIFDSFSELVMNAMNLNPVEDRALKGDKIREKDCLMRL